MGFEIGKHYRHTTGMMLHVLGTLDTTLYGPNVLIAEVARSHSSRVKAEPGRNDAIPPEQQAQPRCGHYDTLMAVGKDEGAAVNFSESTEEEWMKNFS